ncbi:S41 family peptidase [Williamwhitmania taraxaci]|uniref:Carboxyl-terminal processing protease n=1 Tax=Williamwhitmania taraxaci TaxID=1640674 RepID=A0A1G6QJS5_9BACT|nr:S41 family peptidase [Williamwhitmania taraxaci]SDC91885.1 carboxyl-terminal processing protease [Williamwhitmania taraxaci]
MGYENTKRQIWLPLLLALAVVVGIFIGSSLHRSNTPTALFFPNSGSDKIQSVLKLIQDEYVDTVSVKRLEEKALEAIAKGLDPHTVYIPAEKLAEVNEPLDGEFSGIGVHFNVTSDTVVVISTVPGGPSVKVGVMPGDRIVTVNGKIIAGVKMDQDSIVKRLRGPNGSKVKIGLKRSEVKELIDVTITRDRIPLYSIDASYMVNDSIGYIKIARFARSTYQEFFEATNKLHKQGMKSVILDLRGNTGGFLDQAVQIANEFLPAGRLIVYTQGNARPRQNLYSDGKATCKNDKVVILIDEFSASASEILAGALQDNDKGTIIGRRSFGKGLVQEQIPLADNSALRLTVARYYTPTGRSIQKHYTFGSEEEYAMEISNRYAHGEFEQVDSIKFADSLKYKTPGGKIVYGGGGIMPDIFIPLDTIGINRYFRVVSARNLIYRYAFSVTDSRRNVLAKFKNVVELENYLNTINVLKGFETYARNNKVVAKPGELKVCGKIIETQLKAYIARDILDNDGFYPIISRIDNTLQKAISILKGDTGISQSKSKGGKKNIFALLLTKPRAMQLARNKA